MPCVAGTRPQQIIARVLGAAGWGFVFISFLPFQEPTMYQALEVHLRSGSSPSRTLARHSCLLILPLAEEQCSPCFVLGVDGVPCVFTSKLRL